VTVEFDEVWIIGGVFVEVPDLLNELFGGDGLVLLSGIFDFGHYDVGEMGNEGGLVLMGLNEEE